MPGCAPASSTHLTPDGLLAEGGRNGGGDRDSRRQGRNRHAALAGPRRKGGLLRDCWHEDGGHGGAETEETCVKSASPLDGQSFSFPQGVTAMRDCDGSVDATWHYM